MFIFVRSLFAAQYVFRVTLNLGPAQELSNGSRFPGCASLVRRARVNGLTAKQCATMLQSIVAGADSGPLDVAAREMAINAALLGMESDAALWARRGAA